jgi:hypothetical protein
MHAIPVLLIISMMHAMHALHPVHRLVDMMFQHMFERTTKTQQDDMPAY